METTTKKKYENFEYNKRKKERKKEGRQDGRAV